MWDQDFLWYGVRVVQTTLQAFFRSTIAGVVVRGFRSSSVPVTSIMWSSHTDLSGLSPHAQANSSVYTGSPLAAVSRSTSVISLCLGSSASLQVPVTLVPTVQPFYPANLVS